MSIKKLVELVEGELLPQLKLESVDTRDPIRIIELPSPWRRLGVGNYAAVLQHPGYEDYAVKIYAPGRPGLEAEREVYHRLGTHPAYSECYYSGANYLILKRLLGTTVYECIREGIPVPEQVIRDIDEALDYARSKGLYPHDIHAKNVMMAGGRGIVLDVSDFLKQDYCSMWVDFKKAYYRIYVPVLLRMKLPVPDGLLDLVRRLYRIRKSWRKPNTYRSSRHSRP